MVHFVFLVLLLASTHAEGKPGSEGYLLTMTKEEFIEIMKCIAKSDDKYVYKEQEACNKKMPLQAYTAFKECAKEVLGPDTKDIFSSLAKDEGYITKIIDCKEKKIRKYTDEEATQMMEFESCTRAVADSICPYKPRN